MFERYTERARRVLFFARYEATQLGSPSIQTEHLLLGLIREGKGLTPRCAPPSTTTWANPSSTRLTSTERIASTSAPRSRPTKVFSTRFANSWVLS